MEVVAGPGADETPGVVEVRRIRADEGPRLRALRLEALADAPMAFGSTLADEQARPERDWAERARLGAAGETRVTYVAERDRRWAGMAAGFVDDEDPEGVSVVSVWVDPTARERGVGIALVDAVLDWARARGANRADLWVTDTNAAAIALYRRCGFRPTGQSQPLPHTPGIQEIQMARDLRPLDASRGS